MLKDFRLDFNGQSRKWEGSPSTVVEDKDEHVWGAIYQLENSNMASLDKQEGVSIQQYVPFDANVITSDNKILVCRCYKLVKQPTKQTPIPLERRPSKSYKETMLLGAKENSLPEQYIRFIAEIPDNGKSGPSMPWSKAKASTVEYF